VTVAVAFDVDDPSAGMMVGSSVRTSFSFVLGGGGPPGVASSHVSAWSALSPGGTGPAVAQGGVDVVVTVGGSVTVVVVVHVF
jgi:hypothetical protein